MNGQAIEKTLGETAGRVVIDLPPRRHYATHAHVDQLLRQARRQPVTARLKAGHFAEVATTEEHQVRHGLHPVNFGGSQEQAVG
ncbi:hypothetical protein D3C78_1625980 [compost metagenome]